MGAVWAAVASLLSTIALAEPETPYAPALRYAEPYAGAFDAEAAAFEAALDAAYATGDFVGLAVAVVRGGETTFLKTYGAREIGGKSPVTPSTVFRIASLSKGFASSIAGRAMAEGRISADDPAAPYAPEFVLPGGAEARLTLGHVMSHRTGLPTNAYDNLLEEGVSPEEILARYKDVALVCPVGRCYAYQNIAFNIIARAISFAYGAPYDALVGEMLFAPLGMTTASVGEAGLYASGDFARPHRRSRLKGGGYGPWRAAAVKPAYYRVPAASGVNASILDMAEWLKAQLGYRPDILSQAVLASIHAPQVATPSETARIRPASTRYASTHYGYGWRIYDYAGRRVITHSGTVDGYAAQIAFLPVEDVGIVILSNARPRRVWRILPTFLDIELGLPREDWLALGGAGTAAGGSK
jgi:beta-lactamase class C